jgi:hypothetical protein
MCRLAVARAASAGTISKGWQGGLGVVIGMRRWVTLPFVLAVVPALAVQGGGDALSIAFNSVRQPSLHPCTLMFMTPCHEDPELQQKACDDIETELCASQVAVLFVLDGTLLKSMAVWLPLNLSVICFPSSCRAVDNVSYDFFLDERVKVKIEEVASNDATLIGPSDAAALDRTKTIHVVLIVCVSVAQVWSASGDHWWWLPFMVSFRNTPKNAVLFVLTDESVFDKPGPQHNVLNVELENLRRTMFVPVFALTYVDNNVRRGV